MQFLAENRTKVMHKQLTILHTAMCAYYAGDAQALKTQLDQFNIKVTAADSAIFNNTSTSSAAAKQPTSVGKRFTSFLEK